MPSLSRNRDERDDSHNRQMLKPAVGGDGLYSHVHATAHTRLKPSNHRNATNTCTGPSVKSRADFSKTNFTSRKVKKKSKDFMNLSTISKSSTGEVVESDYESGAREEIMFSGHKSHMSVSHVFSWAPKLYEDVTNGDSFALIAGTQTFQSLISSDERCPANPITHLGELSDVYLMELDSSNTPLHCACILHRPADEILRILKIDPKMATVKKQFWRIPASLCVFGRARRRYKSI